MVVGRVRQEIKTQFTQKTKNAQEDQIVVADLRKSPGRWSIGQERLLHLRMFAANDIQTFFSNHSFLIPNYNTRYLKTK